MEEVKIEEYILPIEWMLIKASVAENILYSWK